MDSILMSSSGVAESVILRNNTINVDGVNVRSLRVSCLSRGNHLQLGEDYIGLIIWHQAHNHKMKFNGRNVYPGYIIYAKKQKYLKLMICLLSYSNGNSMRICLMI